MTPRPVFYVTVAEMADVLRVSPSTVRRWIENGDLEAITLPSGVYRIPRVALDAIVHAGVDPA